MIKRIGVMLKEGCNIEGADLAIKSLADMLDFDEIISIDPSRIQNEKPLFLKAVSDLNGRLKQCVQTTQDLGDFPLVFGGDHALAIGSIAGSLTPETGVLWIDAHGDCNTVTSSSSQRIHGMPLAVLQGHGHPQLTMLNNTILKAKDILQVGIRSLDEQEAIQMKEWGVRTITMEDISTYGFAWMIKEIQLFIADYPKIHISFDCDSIDPCDAPGVNTPADNGLRIEEALALLNSLPYAKVFSMDIVEYNPLQDNGKTKAMILAIDALVHQKKGV